MTTAASPTLTVLTVLLVCGAGGIGAALRFVLDGVVRELVGGAYPVGTTVINLSGSLLLGFVTGLAGGALLPESARLILGTGFLGGYTTFSTASFETVRLLEQRRGWAALANWLGQVVVAVVAAAVGFAAGAALV